MYKDSNLYNNRLVDDLELVAIKAKLAPEVRQLTIQLSECIRMADPFGDLRQEVIAILIREAYGPTLDPSYTASNHDLEDRPFDVVLREIAKEIKYYYLLYRATWEPRSIGERQDP